MSFATPQDAEDAYYDALDSGDAEAMTRVWEASEQIACLLPMTPPAVGGTVHRLWQTILVPGTHFDLEVRHLAWIEYGDLAIHLVEERPPGRGGQVPPPIYGTNVFRRGPDGWRLVLHQNSPMPPPPPGMPERFGTAVA